MATVEELNFALIVDDDEFQKKIKKDKEDAQAMNEALTKLLNVSASKSAFSTKEAQAMSKVTKAVIQQATEEQKLLGVSNRQLLNEEKIAAAKLKTFNAQKVLEASSAKAEAATLHQAEAAEKLATATEKHRAATARAAIEEERLSKIRNRDASSLRYMEGSWKQIIALAGTYVSVLGGISLVKSIVRTTAEFEYQRVTLGAIIQDAEKAKDIFNQIQALAVQSPYTFKDLMGYVKQLSAFSVPVNELYNTTKMLADVASGLGVDMGRVILAYGQIRSASFLRGQEVRQLTEAGVPILEELRKQFVAMGEEGITVGDVFDKIAKRMVPFEMVKKIFEDMTSEGGKFYKMQEVQAQTLQGKISNLVDAYQMMFNKIGEANNGIIGRSVDYIRSLADNYKQVEASVISLVAAFGTFRVVNNVNMWIKTFNVNGRSYIETVKAMSAQNSLFAKSLAFIAKNPYALLISGAVALSAYITKLAVDAAKFKKELQSISDVSFDKARNDAENFSRLVDQLNKATVGSGKYRKAIADINRQYGEYLPSLLNEKNALDEIAKSRENVIQGLYQQQRAYAENEAAKKIEERYGNKLSKIIKTFTETLVTDNGISEEQATRFVESYRKSIEKALKNGKGVNLGAAYESFFGTALQMTYDDMGGSLIQDISEDFRKALEDMLSAQKNFENRQKVLYGGNGFFSEKQYELTMEIEKKYMEEENRIMDMQLSKEAEEVRLLDNRKKKLEEIYKVYMREAQANKALSLATNSFTEKQIQEFKNAAVQWENAAIGISKQIADLQPKEQNGFEKLINGLIGNNFDLKFDASKGGYSEYVANLKSASDEANQELKKISATYNGFLKQRKEGVAIEDVSIAQSKKDLDYWTQRKAVIDSIAKVLSLDLNDSKTGGNKGKSQEQIAIEGRIDAVKELLKWSERFDEKGVAPSVKNETLSKFFPNEKTLIESGKFREELLKLADALEKYDKKAAEMLRNDMGGNGIGDIFDNIVKQMEANDKFKQMMEKWVAGDVLSGEGPTFNISKIIKDYDKAIAEINRKKEEAIEALSMTDFSTEEMSRQMEQIEKIYETDGVNAMAKANEEIRKQADEWVKSWEKFSGFDLSNIGQMTHLEIRKLSKTLKAELKDFYFDGGGNVQNDKLSTMIDTDKELQALAKVYGGKEKLIKGAYDFEMKKEKEVSNKREKDKYKEINMYSDMASSVSDSVAALAEAKGDDTGAEIAKGFSKAVGFANDIVQGFKQGGIFGAIAMAVTKLATGIIDSFTAIEEFRNRLKDVAREGMEYTEEQKRAWGVETEFGENFMRKVSNIYETIHKYQYAARYDMDKMSLAYKSAMDDAAYGSSIMGIKLGTSYMSLADAARSVGRELINEYGYFNSETLQAILDTYEDLKSADKEWLKNAISNAKMMESAMEDLKESINDLFGDISSDISDAFIDAFAVAGDAGYNLAVNLDTIFSDLGKSIAKSLIQSFVIDNVLNSVKPKVEALYESMGKANKDERIIADQYAQVLAGLRDSLGKGVDYANTVLNLFKDAGVNFSASSESDLKNGIQSITEDTANLIASYINGIRADVSYNRTQIAAILGLLPHSPTLADYLTAIQANTYNNAVYTQGILTRIDNMMTSEGGASALRVYNS